MSRSIHCQCCVKRYLIQDCRGSNINTHRYTKTSKGRLRKNLKRYTPMAANRLDSFFIDFFFCCFFLCNFTAKIMSIIMSCWYSHWDRVNEACSQVFFLFFFYSFWILKFQMRLKNGTYLLAVCLFTETEMDIKIVL